jgi:hypothetical protein
MIKIQVIACRNYRTEVLVNDKLAYQTGIHRDIEMEHLNRLVELLGLADKVEVIEEREKR